MAPETPDAGNGVPPASGTRLTEEPKVILFARTPGYTLAAWRRIFFIVWHGPASVEGIEQGYEFMRGWIGAHDDGAGLVIVVTPGQGRPSEPAREAMKRMVRLSTGRLVATTMLFEGDGFAAAFARGLIAGLRLLRPGPAAFEVFPTADQTARWMSASLGRNEHPVPAFLSALRVIRNA